jgi:hypothetical protein
MLGQPTYMGWYFSKVISKQPSLLTPDGIAN